MRYHEIMTESANFTPVVTVDPVEHILTLIAQEPSAKWGLRIVDEPVADTSAILPLSRKWTWKGPTKRLLSGTSTIGISRPTRAYVELALAFAGIPPYAKAAKSFYLGKHVYLVKGTSWRSGIDDGEKIMKDARVVAEYSKENDGVAPLLPNTA